MDIEELFEDSLPAWAVGKTDGEYVLGAQLPTRDGRRCGNAHIIGSEIRRYAALQVHAYTVLTDAGTEMVLSRGELEEMFHPPVWVSDVNDVKAKFSRPEPPEPETMCCKFARDTHGWNHDIDCPNHIVCY